MIDYLKLTSCDRDDYTAFEGVLLRVDELITRLGKVGAYRGLKTKHGFAGEGRQQVKGVGAREPHFLMIASSETAQSVWRVVKHWAANCTRIDLQVSLDRLAVNYNALHQALKPVCNTKRISSATETVYIGSRLSETYIRIYQHHQSLQGLVDRFEVEYKGRKAQAVFERPFSLQGILMAEILKVSKRSSIAAEQLTPFLTSLEAGLPQAVRLARKEPLETAQYYERVVRPYLWRVLFDKELQGVIREDISRLLQLSLFEEDDDAPVSPLKKEIPDIPKLKRLDWEAEDISQLAEYIKFEK